ncbi:diguanylate cyclase domain-containing protein [Modestobacter lacusdianchii]
MSDPARSARSRAVRSPLLLALLLTLAGIAVTVPLSPAGALPQWDDLVLAAAGMWAAVHGRRLTRRLHGRDRLPWLVLSASALLFGVAGLLSGFGVGGSIGQVGTGECLVLVAALGPTVSAALVGGRVRGTRWPVLVVDGAMVTVALVIVADVLVLSPALAPGAISPGLKPLVLAYGIYPAVAVGLVGALCTVSTAAVRRPATAMIVMTGLLGVAASCLALQVLRPGGLWSATGDVAIAGALVVGVRAVQLAGAAGAANAGSAPVVNTAGVAVDVLALGGVPVTLVLALLLDLPVGTGEVACTAALIGLLLLRLVLRIRDSGRIQADLVRSEEDFRELVEASSDGVAIVDTDLRLEFTSPAARTLLGLVRGGDRHPVLLHLLVEEDRERVRAELSGPAGPAAQAVHLRVPVPGAEPRELEVTHHERPGSGRRVLHLRDATTRRRRERELERMAFTDHLTRLPNRAMLFREMAAPAAGDRSLLVLDLDGFKAVNDSAGHESGDLLLVEVARRLGGLVRADDLVARLGGDEFAVLLSGAEDAATEAAQRVVDVLARPYRVGDRTFGVGASVGLCRVHPGGGQLAFRQADAALRAAKEAGKGCWRMHTEDRVAQAAASSSVAAALADGDVQLRFDTIANGDTGILAALHAQPVWVHPELGVLPAAELWAAAERQGQTAALQRWLIARACADVAELDDQLLVAVDLPAGLVHADELPGEVADALAAAALAPHRLTLFVTEEVLQTSSAALIPALHTVHRTGVRIGLDDYGMGSTLWSQLARLPLEVVMVDVRTLSAGGDRDRTLELLGAIGRSARGFEVSTVAKEIASSQLLHDLRVQGEVAVAGPILPSGLTAAQAAALLRHPSSAVVAPLPAARPHAGVS